jgi:hypothetical protein
MQLTTVDIPDLTNGLDTYSQQQLEHAIEIALSGKGVSAIIKALNTSHTTFFKYRQCNTYFAAELARAVREGEHCNVDRLDDILEEYPNVLEARLMSENIKWRASKRMPQVYGDRLEVNVNETVSIRAAIDEGRQRAFRDVTVLALPADASATGSAPVAADSRGAEPAPVAERRNAVAAYQPIRVKTALDAPITRGADAVATLATPSPTRSVIERFNAKNAAVSQSDTDSVLDVSPEPIDPLS